MISMMKFVKTKSLNNVANNLQNPSWYIHGRDRWVLWIEDGKFSLLLPPHTHTQLPHFAVFENSFEKDHFFSFAKNCNSCYQYFHMQVCCCSVILYHSFGILVSVFIANCILKWHTAYIWQTGNAYRILTRISEEKKPLWRPSHR